MEIIVILHSIILLHITLAFPSSFYSDRSKQLVNLNSYEALNIRNKRTPVDINTSVDKHNLEVNVLKRVEEENSSDLLEAQLRYSIQKPVTRLGHKNNGTLQHNWKHALVSTLVENNLDRIINYISGEHDKYINDISDVDRDNSHELREKTESVDTLFENSSLNDGNGPDTLNSQGQSSPSISDVPNLADEKKQVSESGTTSEIQAPTEVTTITQNITIFHVLEAVLFYIINSFASYTVSSYSNQISNRLSNTVETTTSYLGLINLHSIQEVIEETSSQEGIEERSELGTTPQHEESNLIEAEEVTEYSPSEYRVQYINFRQPTFYELLKGLSSIFSTLYLSFLSYK